MSLKKKTKKKHPYHDAFTSMFRSGNCIGQVMSIAWQSPHIQLRMNAKKFNIHLPRRENHISNYGGISCAFFLQTLCRLSYLLHCGEASIWPIYQKQRLMEGCSNGWLCGTFTNLATAPLEFSHSELWVRFHLSHQGSTNTIDQLSLIIRSRYCCGPPKQYWRPLCSYEPCVQQKLICILVQICALSKSVSELLQNLMTHLLGHAVWVVRSYIDRFVPFLIKSNLNTHS